jgi:hypothetical protein
VAPGSTRCEKADHAAWPVEEFAAGGGTYAEAFQTKKGAARLVVVALSVGVVLLATDTVALKCGSHELEVPEAVEDARENVENPVKELTDG